MLTFVRIGIAVLLTALVALSACQKKTINAVAPDRLSLNGIGINGHMDKISGQWIPAWGYIDAQGDTVCCFWTEIEATTIARAE
jgi:hypothetical protein